MNDFAKNDFNLKGSKKKSTSIKHIYTKKLFNKYFKILNIDIGRNNINFLIDCIKMHLNQK